jgi:internalin A
MNQIQKIEGLDSLFNLTFLNLFGNQITKKEGLEGLDKLVEFHLGAI